MVEEEGAERAATRSILLARVVKSGVRAPGSPFTIREHRAEPTTRERLTGYPLIYTAPQERERKPNEIPAY